ncbi:4351_t:CDS:2 [Ambispora leptoticha]|uniref:4351_t:CDS:1 n=1 Tax=Ambispora leptoticha TaxID=144679 RepID=A0A9N9DC86_9GLOM|nr:4351_t:CDS:2 [Ambispora leptoticha]
MFSKFRRSNLQHHHLNSLMWQIFWRSLNFFIFSCASSVDGIIVPKIRDWLWLR